MYASELQPVDVHAPRSRICDRTALCTALPLLPPAGQGCGGAARLWFLAEEAAMLKTQREGTALKWAAEHAENTRISWLCKQTAESGEQREAYTEREQRRASELISAADISGVMHTVSRTAALLQPSCTCDPWHRHSSTLGALLRIPAPHLTPIGTCQRPQKHSDSSPSTCWHGVAGLKCS